MELTCTDCHETKLEKDFYKSKLTENGREECCKICARVRRDTAPRQYRRKRYEEIHLTSREIAKGMLETEYQMLYRRQGGLCWMCRQKCSRGDLAIDHDHSTGEVRGLLCARCNLALGYLRDDPELLNAGVQYLRTARTGIPYLKKENQRLLERKKLLTPTEQPSPQQDPQTSYFYDAAARHYPTSYRYSPSKASQPASAEVPEDISATDT